MASNYPSSADALSNPASGDALSTGHAAQHANANDAIEAIESTLGLNPQGASATVKARLDAIEADSWVTSARILDGTIVNGDVSASAAIDPSKVAQNVVTFSNADAVVATSTRKLVQIGTMSASRTVTLPAASGVPAGTELVVADLSGSVTTTNTIVVSRAGSDTVNGATSTAIGAAYGWRRFVSDGSSKWVFDGGVNRTSDTGTITSANIADGTIVNADISASAAIIGTKLADGAITPIKTSGGYLDKSTAYSITNDDRVLDVTGTTTVTLPTSASNSGRAFFVRNSGTATVTIATTSSQTIDGASTLTIPGKGFLEVVADGSNWHVIRGQYAGDETYGRRIFSWNHAYSTGGGWQQVYGDTGIRSISSWDAAGTVTGTALPTGWGPVSGQAGFYRLQRVGSRVTATIQMLQATSTNPTPLSVPAGFTSGSYAPQFLVPMVPGSGAQVSRTWQQSGGLGRGASTLFTANDYVYQSEFTWLTPDAWPASLPGAAVGVIPL